jgi:hypothetical protein
MAKAAGVHPLRSHAADLYDHRRRRANACGWCGSVTPHRRFLFALLALSLVLGTFLSACSAAPTATPTPLPTTALDASGQPILKDIGGTKKASVTDLASWKAAITKVGRVKTISEPGLVPLDAKGVWLILRLNATNGSSEAGSFPRQNLVVKDAAGKTYKVDENVSEHYSIGEKIPTPSAAVAPKGSYEGAAVFDIDPAATGLKLELGSQQVPIKE